MIIRNKLWIIVLSLALVGCASRNDETIVPTPWPTSLPVVKPTRTPGPPAPTSIPEPTSTPYSISGPILKLDPNTRFFPHSVLLSIRQQLIVVPLAGWGYTGWDVTFAPEFLKLDPQIDAKHPPDTGWIWMPLQAGQTQLRIKWVDPCHLNITGPPCGIPDINILLDITIIE